MRFYWCPYILQNETVCNKGCYHLNGYKVHQNSPKQVPCKEKECDKMTSSGYGACKKHSSKDRNKEYYHRKELANSAEHKWNQVNGDVLINQNKLGPCQEVS